MEKVVPKDNVLYSICYTEMPYYKTEIRFREYEINCS